MPDLTSTGRANLKQPSLNAGIRNQVMRRCVSYLCANHVARAHFAPVLDALWKGQVHQSIIASSPRDTPCGLVLATYVLNNQNFYLAAFPLFRIHLGDSFQQGD